MTTPDETLTRRARTLYHAVAQRLDPALATRLRNARREMLAGNRHAPHHVVRWLVPSGACAAIALAAVLTWPAMPRPDAAAGTPAAASQTAEVDNLLPPDPEQADPNLYQNLDFYGWLAANDSQPAH